MIKIFLSHSSAQKPFVREVAKELGHNTAIVDEYTFEAGKEIWNEIREAIDNSRLFVYFISQEALKSPWVKNEMNYLTEKVMDGQIEFLPFIIDDTPHTDKRIKQWVRNKILLKQYKSPKLIARKIKQEMGSILLDNNLIPDLHGHLFEGRDEDIRSLRQSLNSVFNNKLRAIFISGQIACGRQRLLREIINLSVRHDRDLNYRPISIRLDENADAADLIGLLNDYTRTFDADTLMEKLKFRESTRNAAVRIFNDLEVAREYAIIEEQGVIVRSNGKLVDWFAEILTDDNLIPRLHFFLASKYALDPSSIDSFLAITRSIGLIDEKGIRSLINGYLKLRDMSAETDIKDKIASLSKGYPDVVYTAIDILKTSNPLEFKNFLLNYVSPHDREIGKQIAEVEKEPEALEILVLLSKFDFMTFTTLVDILSKGEEEALKLLLPLSRAGLCESFGKSNSYLRLAPPVRDYITRFDFDLNGKGKTQLRKKMIEYIEAMKDENLISEDYGTILMTAKEAIKHKGVSGLPKKYLIPAFILKAVMEEYNAQKYDSAIELAKSVIYGYNEGELYESLKASIRYWYCLALARKNNDEALKEADYLNDYNKYFVRGFYYTCLIPANYKAAAKEFRKAVNISPKAIKAKHQLVVCLQKLNRHGESVKLAKECYDEDPTNRYYIQAYFESLLKSEHLDPYIMDELIDAMSKSMGQLAKALQAGMKAQRAYYIYRDLDQAFDIMKKVLEDLPESSSREKVLRVAKEIAADANAIHRYEALKRISSE